MHAAAELSRAWDVLRSRSTSSRGRGLAEEGRGQREARDGRTTRPGPSWVLHGTRCNPALWARAAGERGAMLRGTLRGAQDRHSRPVHIPLQCCTRAARYTLNVGRDMVMPRCSPYCKVFGYVPKAFAVKAERPQIH